MSEHVAGQAKSALRRLLKVSCLTLVTVALPRLVSACAVCFGDPEAPQRIGANYAVLALLVVVGGVLASFAAFFLHLKKRAGLVQAGESDHREF